MRGEKDPGEVGSPSASATTVTTEGAQSRGEAPTREGEGDLKRNRWGPQAVVEQVPKSGGERELLQFLPRVGGSLVQTARSMVAAGQLPLPAAQAAKDGLARLAQGMDSSLVPGLAMLDTKPPTHVRTLPSQPCSSAPHVASFQGLQGALSAAFASLTLPQLHPV